MQLELCILLHKFMVRIWHSLLLSSQQVIQDGSAQFRSRTIRNVLNYREGALGEFETVLTSTVRECQFMCSFAKLKVHSKLIILSKSSLKGFKFRKALVSITPMDDIDFVIVQNVGKTGKI